MQFEIEAVLGFAMVATFTVLIMTRRLSALVALILVPPVFALFGGFATRVGPMMLDGIRGVAPTGIMLIFALLYFGIMSDAGLFEPVVRTIVRIVDGDPLKIVVGTAVLALFISLDGDGATTYLITTGAMRPVYARLRMCPLVQANVILLASGVMNILPWGGPTARAASALNLSVSDVFYPMVPALLGSILWVLLVAVFFGYRERRRLGIRGPVETSSPELQEPKDTDEPRPIRRGIRKRIVFVFNALLTSALMLGLFLNLLPVQVLFMLAFALALLINHRDPESQRKSLERHAGNALAVGALIFAAGGMTGILSGTGMVVAMSRSMVALVPDVLGPYLAPITGLASIPLTFFLSNDAWYFGVLPVFARAAENYGIPPEAIARASLAGQPVHLLSPLVASTYFLVALLHIEFGEQQRFTLFWAFSASVVLLLFSLLSGAVPLVVPAL